MITIPVVVRNWSIKTPEVYRYLDQIYIDDFFNTGKIRLGTFAQFKKYPDEQRGDNTEGKNVLFGFGDGKTIVALTQHGVNSFILCTSTEENKELMNKFNANGYFKIKDSTGFGAAISNRIPGFIDGIEGFCKYSEQRNIQRQLPDFNFDDLKAGPESNQIGIDKLFALTAQIGREDVFFNKHISFIHQNEYRFVWNVSHPTDEAVIIECPEAVNFCEKVT